MYHLWISETRRTWPEQQSRVDRDHNSELNKLFFFFLAQETNMLQWWADLRSGVSDWNGCLCSSIGMTKGPPQNANCSFWNVLLGYGPAWRRNPRSIAFLQLHSLDVVSNFSCMWWSCAAWICTCVHIRLCKRSSGFSCGAHPAPQPGVCWDLSPCSGSERKKWLASAARLITVGHRLLTAQRGLEGWPGAAG